jgi:Cu/Ag efflux pump CusA
MPARPARPAGRWANTHKESPALKIASRLYAPLLGWSLQRPWAVLALVMIPLVLSI